MSEFVKLCKINGPQMCSVVVLASKVFSFRANI